MVRSNTTPDGYELPPLEMEGSFSTSYTNLSDEDYEDRFGRPRTERNDDGTMSLGSDPMLKLPSGVTPQSLVPSVDYTSALGIVNSHMDELAQDMPELLYTKALDSAARDSSKVLEIQLAGAIDRAKEARGNLENAVVRATQMAMSIGQKAGLEPYRSFGSYDAGDLDYEFDDRPVVPPDPSEQAEEASKKAAALQEKIEVLKGLSLPVDLLSEEVANLVGVDKRRIERMMNEASTEVVGEGEVESALGQLLRGATAAGNGNGNGDERGPNEDRGPTAR
jgi:hypothetical protein